MMNMYIKKYIYNLYISKTWFFFLKPPSIMYENFYNERNLFRFAIKSFHDTFR